MNLFKKKIRPLLIGQKVVLCLVVVCRSVYSIIRHRLLYFLHGFNSFFIFCFDLQDTSGVEDISRSLVTSHCSIGILLLLRIINTTESLATRSAVCSDITPHPTKHFTGQDCWPSVLSLLIVMTEISASFGD